MPGPETPLVDLCWLHTGVPNFPLSACHRKKLETHWPQVNPLSTTFCLPEEIAASQYGRTVTDRNDPAFSALGLVNAAVLGLTDPAYASSLAPSLFPNMDGFPQRRRLGRRQTRIELQAVSGLCSLRQSGSGIRFGPQ
ncbi:MAG: hypothetical protein R3C61_02970 [Bacteroidia bacterium]